MTLFHDLWRMPTRPPYDSAVENRLDELFPDVVRHSPLTLWTPGSRAPAHGDRLLIGVATWNGYDMSLLDVLADAFAGPTPPDVRVEVFEMNQLTGYEDLIPDLGRVCQSPAVGHWKDGGFRESASGFHGRRLALGVCGLDPEPADAFITSCLQRP